MPKNEMDYASPHRCPVLGQEISADVCYDCVMVLTRMIKISAVPELQAVPDIEAARKTCAKCPYSNLE